MVADLPRDSTSEGRELRRFDFKVLFALLLFALWSAYFGAFGLHLAPRHGASIFYLTLLTPTTAALLGWLASILPRRAGLPIMPIIEAWKANPKYSTMRSVSLGFGLGLIHVGISYIYTSDLRSHFGPAHPKTSLPLNFYTSAHAAIFEEIFFRGTILPAFILFIRWVWETPITSSAAPFWLANVAQALLFGLDHRHLYTQLAELPLWLQSIHLPANVDRSLLRMALSEIWSGDADHRSRNLQFSACLVVANLSPNSSTPYHLNLLRDR